MCYIENSCIFIIAYYLVGEQDSGVPTRYVILDGNMYVATVMLLDEIKELSCRIVELEEGVSVLLFISINFLSGFNILFRERLTIQYQDTTRPHKKLDA